MRSNMNNVTKLRKAKGYTLKEMANKLGVSTAYYHRMEHYETYVLSYKYAYKIAAIFNTTPDKLFYDYYANQIKNEK